jgi:hypothetical protein
MVSGFCRLAKDLQALMGPLHSRSPEPFPETPHPLLEDFRLESHGFF